MARIPRKNIVLSPGCFHVMTRGNNGMTIFYDELDYQHYLSLVRHYKIRYLIKTYAYCLMSNHVHLLVETKLTKALPKFMHGMNLAYSLYYQSRYSWKGHLWQDRYKSYLIEKEKYLMSCIEYICTTSAKGGHRGSVFSL